MNNILITGLPGTGKTTLFMKLVDQLRPMNPAGFYTDEIRQHGVRKGFRLTDLHGETMILSHTDIESRYRVGKYGVDIAGFNAYLDRCCLLNNNSGLVMIDEIGKMECLSDKFKEIVGYLLETPTIFIATIALKGRGFIADIKIRDDVKIYEITYKNRDFLIDNILKDIGMRS